MPHTNFFLFIDNCGTLGDSRPMVSLAFHITDYLKTNKITNAEVCLVLYEKTDKRIQSDQLFKSTQDYSRKKYLKKSYLNNYLKAIYRLF